MKSKISHATGEPTRTIRPRLIRDWSQAASGRGRVWRNGDEKERP